MTADNASTIIENKDEILNQLPEDFKTLVYNHTSEQMPELDEGEIDLIVTSPPYPMIEMWDHLGTYSEQHETIKQVMSECYEKLRRGGIMCINIGDATRNKSGSFRYYPNHAKVTENAEKIGFDSLIPIFWKKPQNGPNKFMGSGMKPPNAYVTNEMEYILIFRKGPVTDPRRTDLLRKASMYSEHQRNEWFSQIWEVGGANQDDGHAVYPFEIPYRLIRMFSLLGDTVLDPFAGSGTTLKAARALGRHSVGFETEENLMPVMDDKVSEVNNIPTVDILKNHIRVDRDGAKPETFHKNPQSLVDIF